MTDSISWVKYTEARPSEGQVRWRLPSQTLPGLHITFIAHMRKRHAGYEFVTSPMFDHWDGYNVLVPKDLEWQALAAPVKCEDWELTGLALEGVAMPQCPYCDRVPVLHGVQAYNGGGVGTKRPDLFNRFGFKCCGWGETPTSTDPRILVERRRQANERLIANQLGSDGPRYYEHILRNERGEFLRSLVSNAEGPEFGRPDIDYDKTFSVSQMPLYAGPETVLVKGETK